MSLASLLLLAAACAPAVAGAGPGVTGPAPMVYVPNQSSATVSVIDTRLDSVVATVDLQALGFSATAKPHHVAVEPDGSHWYVSLIGENTVVKFDRENHIVGRATTEIPGLLALDAAHHRLFASRTMSAVNAPSSIAAINTDDMSVIEEVDVVLPRPHAIAVTPDGGRVFVGSMSSNQVAVYQPESGSTSLFELEGPVHAIVQFAVSPDGTKLVGTGQLTNQLLVYDISGTGTPTRISAMAVPEWPWLVQFSADGKYVWMANQHGSGATKVRTSDWTVVDTITSDRFAEPHGVAVSPDGSKIYISDQGRGAATPTAGHDMASMHADTGDRSAGGLFVLDAASSRVIKVIPTGRYAAGIGIGGGG